MSSSFCEVTMIPRNTYSVEMEICFVKIFLSPNLSTNICFWGFFHEMHIFKSLAKEIFSKLFHDYYGSLWHPDIRWFFSENSPYFTRAYFSQEYNFRMNQRNFAVMLPKFFKKNIFWFSIIWSLNYQIFRQKHQKFIENELFEKKTISRKKS